MMMIMLVSSLSTISGTVLLSNIAGDWAESPVNAITIFVIMATGGLCYA